MKRHRPNPFHVLALWLCLGSLGLPGAVFELTNGDRISGEIVARDAKSVRLKTELLGEVTLPVEAFRSLPPPEPVSPEVAAAEGVPEAAPKVPVPAAAAKVSEATATEPGPAVAAAPTGAAAPTDAAVDATEEVESEPGEMLGAVQAPMRRFSRQAYKAWYDFWEDNLIFRTLARYYPLMSWNNQVDVGLFLQMAETDEQKMNLRFRTEKREGVHQMRLEAQYEFASTTTRADGIETNKTTRDRIRANARYRFDYAKSFFIQSDTRYQRDTVKRINHDADELIGIGYRWLDEARMQASVTPSFGAGFRDISGQSERSFDWIGSLQQDFELSLSERVKVIEESSLTYAPTNEGSLLFNFQASLENRLNARLSMVLRYDLTWDDRIPANVEKTTQGISLSFAARF